VAEAARLQEIADLEAKLAQLAGRRARRARRTPRRCTQDATCPRTTNMQMADLMVGEVES